MVWDKPEKITHRFNYKNEVLNVNKVALVTGGTSGIGFKLIQDLLAGGYYVVTISRDGDKIKKAKNELKNENVCFVSGDISDEKAIDGLYNMIAKEYQRLDVLVNNAGIIYPGGIEKLEGKDWDKMLDINLTAPYKLTQKMIPLLKKQDNSSIINISSISSKVTGSSIAYSTCKAGIDMMTKALAKELSKYNIRVNSVNPGLIDTGFQVSNNLIKASEYGEFIENNSSAYPLGIGKAKDISNLIMFLISDKARWITGVNYIIDGGKSVNI